MRHLIKFLLLYVLLASSSAHALPNFKKLYDTGWVEAETIRLGYVTSFCVFQSLNGQIEGYHFRQAPTYIVTEKNYHTYVTLQRISPIALGWFTYAGYKTDKFTSWEKIRILLGGAFLARNFFEWNYKWNRYNNPFDYSPERNRHALVGVKLEGGKFVDFYIGTGHFTGPLVDVSFALIGTILLSFTPKNLK